MPELIPLPADPQPVILNQDAAAPPPATPPAAPPPVDPAPVESVDDEFARMFAGFSKPDDAPAAPPVLAPPAAAAPPPAEPPAPVEPPPAPVEPPPPQPDPIERLADILAQRQQAQPQPQYQQPPQQQPQIFTPEEATALQEFYKEWPEIARAQELTLRAAVTQTTNHVFTEVARVLGPRLQLLESLANNVQYDTLERRVPDYDQVLDKVADWVQKQPTYLRQAYTGVMQGGTPDEVVDLIDRYRQATGSAAPTPGVPNPSPALAPPALSPAAKQAAARLAPVSGKRTGPVQGQPVDFDNAFAEFAKSA